MNSSIRLQVKNLFLVLVLGTFSGCGKAPTSSSSQTIAQSAHIPAVCKSVQASTDIVPVRMQLQTLYGTVEIQEPVLIDLLASKAMQRLKKINQHGINDVVKPEWAFSRYDHSVGVFALTRMFGGSLEEQVAALLHDVSHTVFSHVGDLVFAAPAEVEADSAYQDDIHEWFVEQTDLAPILHTYGMRHVVSDEAKDTFRLLEQAYPDLCTDRLDYQLRTAYIVGLITLADVHNLLHHLHFENGLWFFDDVAAARQFCDASIWLTRNMYASAWNIYLYKFAADAFKRALEIGLVSAKELHFSVDDIIWDRMQQSDDQPLRDLLQQIEHYQTAYEVTDASDYDYFKKSKCRVVDPLVEVGDDLVRLTSVDPEFAEKYQAIQAFCDAGVYLKFRTIEG